MSGICAGLAFWFAILVIGPTLDVTINTPVHASWSSR